MSKVYKISDIAREVNAVTTPEYFGAIGDGATDDSIAIQSALTYLGGIGGGDLILNNRYRYSQELICGYNTRIKGNGVGELKRINEIKTTLTANASAGANAVVVTNTSGFSVGMSVRVYKASYNDANYNTNKLTITSIVGSTINFSGTLSQAFSTGDFIITASKGLVLKDGCIIDGVVFDGNSSNNTSFNRWDVHADVYGIATDSYIIQNCKFINGVADPVIAYGEKVVIDSCSFKDINGNAVHFSDTGRCIVNNCFIENTNLGDVNKIGHVGGAISFSDKNKNIVIAGNIITNGLYGIGYTSGSTNSANHFNAIIRDNIIRDCRSGSIDLRSTTDGVRFDDVLVTGNKIYNSGVMNVFSTHSNISKKKVTISNNIIFNGRIDIAKVEDLDVFNNKIYNDVSEPESSLVANDITNICINIATTGSTRIYIDRNITSGGKHGIYISGATSTTGQFIVKNNYIHKSYEAGLVIFSTGENYQVELSHNYISGEATGIDPNWDGMRLCANSYAHDNYVFSQAGRSCVFFNNGNVRLYRNNLFKTGVGTYSITGFGGTTGCEIVDNIINSSINTGNIPIVSNYYKNNNRLGSKLTGTATLVAGVIFVANSNVADHNNVLITKITAGGTEGFLRAEVNAGSGITIRSSSNTDTSTIYYEII